MSPSNILPIFNGQPQAIAPIPTRSSGSIVLSWGLLTIPLSVYASTESTSLTRKEFVDKDPERPVGRAAIDKNTGEIVEPSSITRMAQADDGTWVELTDDEIRSCTLERGLAEIVTFVPIASASQYLVEDLAQVRPQSTKGKTNPSVDRAFALFLAAMKDQQVVALIKYSVRGPARYGLITPDGNLLMIRTADQVRSRLALTTFDVSDQELELAKTLIESVGIDAPMLTDDTAFKVKQLVNSKAAGAAPVQPTSTAPASAPIDLAATLMASIQAKKAERQEVTA